ncbi:class I SAM-dependent RNA methyltransferase [Spelaeicoccus albus]|uniref:tRNA/tmRNA/rRNA uracil-C5-methylase (TrmA/RlmC/RlmD family) n=1 Tax=Spelaeicoccus albus TaxID=1280376 RepID=A0A7Z0D3G3_9MICO|nr:TRAM domain-containing protein [Spelaeicoccus albus]NYI68169.1 tRNA/tmRNA/rRNA uracil-C5-methylase (TrmA/RlmC/RlmD family) [Spelaeicoccus albus]
MEMTLDIGAPAAGGTCVARHDGRVVFVSGALPGERVRVRIDDADPSAKFWRASTLEVVRQSPDRVPDRWPEAGPDGVGGAELAHMDLAASRRLKGDVIVEQFRRLAHLDVDVEVEAADGDGARDGLGWRTRMQFAVTPDGRLGAMAARSHDVRPLNALPLAVPAIADLGLTDMRFGGAVGVEVAASSTGDRLVIVRYPAGRPSAADTRALKPLIATGASVVQMAKPPRPAGAKRKKMPARATVLSGADHVTERVELPDVGTRDFRVTLGGFWQVHRAAPALLARHVARAAGVRPGDRVADLYCGAGLFTVGLAHAAGPDGSVVAIEGDSGAVADLTHNLGDADGAPVDVRRGPVAGKLPGEKTLDVAVLDPPRAGAGRDVVRRIAACRPRTIAYVSCDPATLARDCRYFADEGYRIEQVRAFDLFPLTAHVESLVTLRVLANPPEMR